ncbi:quinon protein alcohol dehydrogenase-like superfamily [Flagelloscypha sp. PMI_526]|nr:quinon protein alcohol dehydrogenase-like superfamily [Flagelloscypha sp. PMI_526]
MSDHSKKKSGIVLLSLDGGRWETLSPISQIDILEEILSSYEFDNSLDSGTFKVCDAFDLVVGTGTGGLIAFMFSVLKMSVQEAKDAYIRLYQAAFAPEIRTREERAELLKNALVHLLDIETEESGSSNAQLSATKLKDVEKLIHGCKCHFCISAVTAMSAANTTSPVLFRTYRGRNTSINCSPLQALLATLADVESFLPVEIETEKFISTNLGYFNPSEELIKEAASIFSSDNSISAIVSIGPGRPAPITVNGLGGFPQALLERAKDCQAASDRITARFSRHPDLYMRFEVETLDLNKQDFGTSTTITSHSRAYLNRDEIHDRLRALNHSLTNRPRRLKILHVAGLDPGVTDRIEDGILRAVLDKLDVSRDAPYNSAAARLLQRRTCTRETRTNILQQIISWAKDTNHPLLPSLFWIFGLAGTGKSTIAQSVCEILKEEGLLSSSYFCSIQLDSKDSKRIVPTIVSHLATRLPIFAKHLASTLRADPESASARISDQFRDLLCAPWSLFRKEVEYQHLFVVVIDALDECDSGEEVLRLILDAIDHNQLQGIRLLATSRPVPRLVERALKLKRGPQVALHEVKKEEVSSDIGRFLEEQLHEMEPAIIHELTARSDGLFIFASTLVKHLAPTPGFMTRLEIQERLRQILKPVHQREEVGLDALYDHILHDALSLEKLGPEGLKQRLIILQAVVSMEQATTARVISDFLGYDVEDVIGIVNGLHSVLFTRGADEPIYIIHASFRDFVVSQAQEPFKCDPSSIQNRLAQSCLSWMQANLKFNICDIKSSFISNDNLPAPLDSIRESLAYASRHWWAHVMRCTEAAQKEMRPDISELMEKKGIFWIEVMTFLGDERRCRDILTKIALTPSMAPDPRKMFFFEIKKDTPKLHNLAMEAANMVSWFMSISPKMTSHLYLSVLSLWEGNNLECWKSQFQRLPRVKSRHAEGTLHALWSFNLGSTVNSVALSPDGTRIVSGSFDNTVRVWDAASSEELRRFDGHRYSVTSVAFSPDGNHVVSGSGDKTVRIWDIDSGNEIQKLDGRGYWVSSVAFSQDGKRVASGSHDNTVWIWDTYSGEQLWKLGSHGSSVTPVAFSPDGKYLASGCDDKTVRIWDTDTGKRHRKLAGHGYSVTSVAFSPDSKCVASGSGDKTVQIWDADSGKQVWSLDGHGSSVTSVAFSPDGKCVASGSGDKTVQIWDADTSRLLRNLDGHGSSVTSVAFSPDSKRVISGSEDKTVRTWDAEASKPLPKVDSHGSSVTSVAFSPDSKSVVSGSEDKTVRIWDADSGKQLWKLDGHGSSVTSVAFSSDGKYVIFSCVDNAVRIWDTDTGKRHRKLAGHGSSVTSVAFSLDGKHIVSGSKDMTVRIWDADSGKQLWNLSGHGSSVTSIAFSPDGKCAVSGSEDKTVRIWDVGSGNEIPRLTVHGFFLTSVAFSPDGKRVVSGSRDKIVRIWDVDSGRLHRNLDGHGSSVTSVAFSPDSKRVMSGSRDRTVQIWNADSGRLLWKLGGHLSSVTSVAFSPDGKRVVSGCDDMAMRIWDTVTGRLLWKLGGYLSSVTSVAFSPDGKRVASGSRDNTVRIWDADFGRLLRNLDGHGSSVTSVAFSPDSKRVISGSEDRTVRIWGADSGKLLRNLDGHRHWVSSVAFSPDGKRVVSGSHDNTVRIWDTDSGRQLWNLDGHGSSVTSVAFSPDGKHVASGSEDKTVRIWDADSGNEIPKLSGHLSSVTSVAFSPDGKRVVSGSRDKTARIWVADSGGLLRNLDGHGSWVTSVGFSLDSRRVVSGSEDRTVRIWDADTGKQLWKLGGHLSSVTSVAFSPDSKRVVSSSEDKTVCIWNADLGKHRGNLKNLVKSISFYFDSHPAEEHFQDAKLNIKHTLVPSRLSTVSKSNRIAPYALYLNPISTSCYSSEDGWVVTSKEYTGAEHRIFRLPLSLRPYDPHALMVISEIGFNRIDLGGCTFGDGWSTILHKEM